VQGWEGLADSIVGAVTVFWMALLSDRAFQMTPTNWHGNSVRCGRLQGLVCVVYR
jgi:integral membrane sensor domain MASE1